MNESLIIQLATALVQAEQLIDDAVRGHLFCPCELQNECVFHSVVTVAKSILVNGVDTDMKRGIKT